MSLNPFAQRCKLHDGLGRNDLFPALNMREDTDHQMDFRRTLRMKSELLFSTRIGYSNL